jgi:hypothetical protein
VSTPREVVETQIREYIKEYGSRCFTKPLLFP